MSRREKIEITFKVGNPYIWNGPIRAIVSIYQLELLVLNFPRQLYVSESDIWKRPFVFVNETAHDELSP